MKDPIVEEVRKHRMEHTIKCGGDLTKICDDMRRIENSSGHAVVSLPGRKIPSPRTSVQNSTATG